MDGQMLGILGAVVGSTLGVTGGIFGTWRSLQAARSEPERKYIWRWAACCWAGITIFLLVLFSIPHPYGFLAFIPYSIGLAWGIHKAGNDIARFRAAGELPAQGPGTDPGKRGE